MKKTLLFSHFGRLNLMLHNFNAMLTVKCRPSALNLFVRIFYVAGVRVNKSKVGIAVTLLYSISKIFRKQGTKGTCMYLKACATMLQQSLGDHIVPDTALIAKCRVSRNNRGLPRLFPRALREAIRAGCASGDGRILRWTLSILYIYRLLEFPGKPNLSTITAPYKGSQAGIDIVKYYTPYFVDAFVRPGAFNKALTSPGNFQLFPL